MEPLTKKPYFLTVPKYRHEKSYYTEKKRLQALTPHKDILRHHTQWNCARCGKAIKKGEPHERHGKKIYCPECEKGLYI